MGSAGGFEEREPYSLPSAILLEDIILTLLSWFLSAKVRTDSLIKYFPPLSVLEPGRVSAKTYSLRTTINDISWFSGAVGRSWHSSWGIGFCWWIWTWTEVFASWLVVSGFYIAWRTDHRKNYSISRTASKLYSNYFMRGYFYRVGVEGEERQFFRMILSFITIIHLFMINIAAKSLLATQVR